MKTAVRYYSRTGNTRMVAQAIGAAAGCQAESIEVPLNEEADLLFLGGGIYWGMIPRALKDFIRGMEAHRVKQVAVFSTAGLFDTAPEIYRSFLKYNDFKVMRESFFCMGKQAFHETVEREAKLFVETVIEQAQHTLKAL